MLKTDHTIVKNATLLPAQDFKRLRKEGFTWIEQLAQNHWTDYNIHDPGITLLELLCYGITDLGYRTDYNMKDLLTTEENGVPVNSSNFHTARQILTTYPLTFNDLRKVLIDLKGVKNAWIEKNTNVKYKLNRALKHLEDCTNPAVQDNCFSLNGLLNVYIEFEEGILTERGTTTVAAIKPIKTVYEKPDPLAKVTIDAQADLILTGLTVYAKTAGKVRLILKGEGRDIFDKVIPVKKGQNALHESMPEKPRLPKACGYTLIITGETADTLLKPVTKMRDMLPYNDIPHVVSFGFQPTKDNHQPFFFNLSFDYEKSKTDVLEAVRNRLHIYRNLCEDFIHVCPLKPEYIGICADVDIAPAADVDEVQAEILHRIRKFVAPAVNFYTLSEMQERGKTMDTIFEGPALEHGFIDDEEFRQLTRRCAIRISDIIRIMMSVPDVLAVRQLTLVSYIEDATTGQLVQRATASDEFISETEAEWILNLHPSRLYTPLVAAGSDKASDKHKLFFYKNDLPYLAKRSEVVRLLQQKRAQDIHASKLKLKGKDLDLPIPVGSFKDLANYYPIQHDLPMNYRVGNLRVPASATPLRKAQARQLKAYLLFFEQIFANYMAQLAHLQSLFSWETSPEIQTYFTQAVTDISDIRDLYLDFDNLDKNLKTIIETAQQAQDRKNRFLDHLMARFGEDMTEYARLHLSIDRNDWARLISDKQLLLEHYPEASAQRLKAFDYRSPELREAWIPPLSINAAYTQTNLTGWQRRVYRLLGLRQLERVELSGHRFFILPNGVNWYFAFKDSASASLFESRHCPNRTDIENLLDDSLIWGSDTKNWEKQALGVYQLSFICNGVKEPIGETKLSLTKTPEEVRDEVISYFNKYYTIEGFHAIEHILLRKRTDDPTRLDDGFMPVQINDDGDCTCIEVTDPYSFRMSIYLPSWSRRFRAIRFRQFVERTLLLECPAHIIPKICWLSLEDMKRLEEKMEPWLILHAQLSIGGCCLEVPTKDDCCYSHYRSGVIPLPDTTINDKAYTKALAELIEVMHSVHNIFPLARLHDCDNEDTDENPEITLNNTVLGSL